VGYPKVVLLDQDTAHEISALLYHLANLIDPDLLGPASLRIDQVNCLSDPPYDVRHDEDLQRLSELCRVWVCRIRRQLDPDHSDL
jgi:hypothetical protein